MKRLMIAAALCVSALSAGALSGCNLGAVNPPGNTIAATLGDQVVLKSTTALSLGELAFKTAEETATAAERSPSFTRAQKAAIGAAVLDGRGYRDKARTAVATGQDASALLTKMSDAITNIQTLTKPGSN